MTTRTDAFVFTASGDAAAEEHFFTITLEEATTSAAPEAPVDPATGDWGLALSPGAEPPRHEAQAQGGADLAMEEAILAAEAL